MLKHAFRVITGVVAMSVSLSLSAQTAPADTTKPASLPGFPPRAGAPAVPRPYKEVITAKAVTRSGFFKIHKVEEKYYFEIPDALLGRDILVVNRISRAQAGSGYAGDQIGENVIRFEKGPNNKLFLRTVSYSVYSKDTAASMFTSVNNSNIQPIAAAFDIKAFSVEQPGCVIDMTDYISGDNEILYFSSSAKSQAKIGALQADKSYIVRVNPYPLNIEITAVKTYGRAPGAPAGNIAALLSGAGGGSGNLTVELNSSLVLLPETPMQARYWDRRVGYFNVGYTDFDANPQGVKSIRLVKRWRLEPKDEDLEKYKRGELVEPKKPIVFYIDPATPKKWIPYLIQGVNDWQAAFEKAGFKNAIIGRMAPTRDEDSTWSLEDARNSAIVYKPSPIANASGPRVADPRSGEIIESHINWYHNVMELIRDWYMIQAGLNDARARQMEFPDELMGELIRFVSSHEVGHTLGLRHNFGSSSTVPVENLRNKAWVEANGHTPSIMDYARFNYVAQPEDQITTAGLFPRIGDYDKWAIEWGYRYFPEYKSPAAEQGPLNKWVIEKLKNRRLWFGDGETNRDEPRSQTEDLGDDAVKASMYGIKNLQRIIPQLAQWTREANSDYENLGDMYGQVTGQFGRYMGHVATNVGGIYKTPKVVEDPGPVFEYEPKSKQAEAVAFLNQQLFTTPAWMIGNDILSKTGGNPLAIIGSIQDRVLGSLFSTGTLNKLIQAEATAGSKVYRMTDLLGDLKKGIWSELATKKTIDVYRRNLQKSYVNTLFTLLTPPEQPTGAAAVLTAILGGGSSVGLNKSDIISVVKAHLAALKNEINAAKTTVPDAMSQYHLQDIAQRIDEALNPKK
ncbi:MAG: zinc-dependent metalloprotease [Chitinophagaceae bacterium]